VGIVFALGAVFGAALALAVLRFAVPHAPGAGPDAQRGPLAIARMVRDLDLDPQQEERVRAIVRQSHGEIRDILDRSRDEIRGLLRPDQQERFDGMGPRSRRGGPRRPRER
jgi:Spy/CpxP family protein refolding chaperone